MPETIGFAILAALDVPVTGFTAIAGASTIASVIGGTVLAGGAIALNALTAKKPDSSQQDGQLTVRQPRAARRRNYGQNYVGGVIMFSEVSAGIRFQVLALSHGEIDSFQGRLLADLGVTVSAGIVTDAYTLSGIGYVHLEEMRGTDTDPAFAGLISTFPSYWTSAHQGKGIAKALVLCYQPESKNFTQVYPGAAPPIYRAYIRGVRVWDPRDPAQNKDDKSTWVWSMNPVLIALDFHRHADGMGLATFDDVFFTSTALTEDWIPAANACDDSIPLKAGGAEVRYSCGGGYELPAPPKDVLNAILATCDGETYQRPDGAIGIRVGKTVAPTVTLTDQHILSYSSFVNGSSGGISQVNVVTAKFTSVALAFQEADADPWRDETSISLTGREETKSLDLSWVQSHGQARRLMKVAMARFNPVWTGQIVTDLDGLRAYGERYIHLTIAELAINEDFQVTSFEILPASMTCVIGVMSADQSMYDWDAEAEEGTAPGEPDTAGGDTSIDSPTSVTATPSSGSIAVDWDPSGRLDTTPRLQYRDHSAVDWIDGVIDTAIAGHVSGLASGHYDIQVEFVVGSLESGWTPVFNIAVT